MGDGGNRTLWRLWCWGLLAIAFGIVMTRPAGYGHCRLHWTPPTTDSYGFPLRGEPLLYRIYADGREVGRSYGPAFDCRSVRPLSKLWVTAENHQGQGRPSLWLLRPWTVD